MELEVRQRFTAIEAVLQSVAESQKAAAARMDRAEARVDKMEARLDKRMDAIGKLIQTGMKLIARSEVRHEKMDLKMREVGEKLDALIMVVDGIVKRPGPNPR
jgi:hypothetical protein